MNLILYIKNDLGDYVALDLFKDEKVSINLNVKNLSDISKIRSDFSQTFTIPCSPTNNKLFQYWYNSDVDGNFNANIRVDAYIEVNSIPFRYGSIQLENCKLKKGLPYCYSITFFGLVVNLSDKFKDDQINTLNFDSFTHNYNQTAVFNAMKGNSIANGDVYYPLINYRTFMRYGDNSNIDLKKNGNTLSYRDFKPAIRDLRIIEAIENRYGIEFSRDFFDRAIFYNKFTACHKDVGLIRASSDDLIVNYTTLDSNVSIGSWGSVPLPYNFSTDEIFVRWDDFPNGTQNSNKRIIIKLKVITTSTNLFRVTIYENGNIYEEISDLLGTQTITVFNKTIQEDSADRTFIIKISSIENTFTFTTQATISYQSALGGNDRTVKISSPSQTTTNSVIKIAEQLPEMKIKDYINSLISQFNLVILPNGINKYYVDTLDSWYLKGKTYDISGLVDIEDITVKKPSVKKKIDFLYQKTDTILGKKYFENNQQSYGDLKAVYNIQGDELKIETQFENLLFERLVDSATSITTDLNAGYFVDISNNPIKGKPISFYRNGIETSEDVHLNNTDISPIHHTATEDNKVFEQVTNSLNFGADVSSYHYAPIDTSLYYNFWKNYIEDLFNKKTRVIELKCKLPIRILQTLQLNDRFIVGQYRYKISTIKVDLTNAEANLELFSDLGLPVDSVDNVIPLTVDSTEYTADNNILTVDTVSIYDPITSYINPSVSITEYNATKGEENFEVKIDTWDLWTVSNALSWVSVNKTNGKKSDYLRVKINQNSGSARNGTITVNTASSNFTITINQL